MIGQDTYLSHKYISPVFDRTGRVWFLQKDEDDTKIKPGIFIQDFKKNTVVNYCEQDGVTCDKELKANQITITEDGSIWYID